MEGGSQAQDHGQAIYANIWYSVSSTFATGCSKKLFMAAETHEGLFNCVWGTKTQPLIFVGCFVDYWVSCAMNKGGFFEIAFVLTHILPHFEVLAAILPHFVG